MNKIKCLIISVLYLFTSCNTTTKTNEKFRIVCTTNIIADAVQEIVGDKAEVVALMGPGVDPHLYKARQNDLSLLRNADLVFYNGLHLEGKMVEVLENLGKTKNVKAVSDGIPESDLLSFGPDKNAHDPHIWFDIRLWKLACSNILFEVSKLDSSYKAACTVNFNNYMQKLDSLNQFTTNSIASIPKESRVLITAHDAFGYFGKAYNIEVRGLQGISTTAEYGIRDITNLVNFIIERKIKAVFVESSIPKKSIEAVVNGCNQKGHALKIGGTLYSDALGSLETSQGNYIGMFGSNVNTIVNALK